MADAPRKPRAPTSALTWACTAAFAIAALGGAYGWYVTRGPGRIVDASAIRPGMTRHEVGVLLGYPDGSVTSGELTALRYGRTHVWLKGAPGRGGIVQEVTTEPLIPSFK